MSAPRTLSLAPAAVLAFLLAATTAPSRPAAPRAVDFGPVRAVLERRCLECHGGGARESGLSFADGPSFAAGGARGPAVDPDDPTASRLLAVIAYDDPDLAMPPSGVLPAAERELLAAWVAAGAPWPEGPAGTLADPAAHPAQRLGAADQGPWWAYEPLVAPPVPAVDDPRFGAHPVDAFVHARRAAAGLAPAAHAAPEALLRRATFDLTGLPPTPAERATFLDDVAAAGFEPAWERLVERLLASPHFGEHQARRWLDLVRYGETNGYERDGTKQNVWRYRDWVVRAFERDLSYDRFAAAQLAGDELAVDEADPRVAADLRLATGYFRLGRWDDEPSDHEQATADELADIVDTTGQVFLGTTFGCARCHDHVADPVSQRDYFAFTAHFAGLVGYGGGRYAQSLGPGATRDVLDPTAVGRPTRAERDAELVALDLELEALLGAPEPARAGRRLVADARDGGARWRSHAGDPPPGWAAPGFDDGDWPEGPGGFGAPGTPGARVGTEWRGPRIQLRTTFRLEALPDALRLSLHHDEDVELLLNGVPILARSGYRTDYGTYQLGPAALDALVVGRNVLALDCRQTVGGQYVDAGLDTAFDPAAEGAVEAALDARLGRLPAGPERSRAEALFATRERLRGAAVAEPFPAQVAFERGGEPPTQHVHLRGSVHAPGEAVEPGVPDALARGAAPGAAPHRVLPAAPDAASSGRRSALARWLFDGGAHLAARVEANRLWQCLFGRGLCPTPGDFGRLGRQPTHPELLDHLAAELIAGGWSRKRLLAYLMASETYRMAVVGPEASRAADPTNALLWRADPRRLTAEEYRDATLAASGELNRERFGPSVFPPLPAEVLATASRPDAAWGRSTPADAVRRSLYVHTKRSLREPLLAALDQPDPDLPCPERFPTNVPTQALLTLNGDFTHARARALAELLLGAEDDPGARAALGIERALGRAARDDERDAALALVDALRRDHALDERSAWTLFALSLFNANEFLWLD